MENTQRVLVLSIIAISIFASVSHAETESYWEGAMSYRGSEMGIRLQLYPVADTLQVELDIPSMLMAWKPIPGSQTKSGISVEFPFGIGKLSIAFDGDRGFAERKLGDNSLVLNIERIGAPLFVHEDVHFMSGNNELAGTFIKPDTKGPYPAFVLLHGSGRQSRKTWEYRSWADLLVRQGLAVFYYDKRGLGDSGGDYPVSLRGLSDDGIAAVDYLHTRSDIDAKKIGLKGSSQGAWLAQQVAIDRGDIAFLILTAAAASTPRDQQMQSVEYGMRQDGLSETLIENALAYYGLYFYVARTGEGWTALEAAVKHAQSDEENVWGQYVDQPRSIEDLNWWGENHDFNPSLLVGQLTIPTIILYGGIDYTTPPTENAIKLKSRFGNPENVAIHVFPGGDHRIELPMGKDESGVWHWPTIAPGLFITLTEWIEQLE